MPCFHKAHKELLAYRHKVQEDTKTVKQSLLFSFFLAIGIIGLGHGFPLIDLFADEMYFVHGPLAAIQQRSILPIGVPYGTITYYADLVLQGIFLFGLWIFSGFDVSAAIAQIMAHPFLVYIPPRVLNLILFLTMLRMTMQWMRMGTTEEAPYAVPLILILFGNLTLLTFSHSGKMWITCIFLLFLTGYFLARHAPKRSMFAASLAFANLPLMGIFWVITFVVHVISSQKTWRQRGWLAAIGISVPVAIFLLNAREISAQIHSIIFSYLAPGATGIGAVSILYGKTFLAYLIKLLITAPLTIVLGVLAFGTRATVVKKPLRIFGILCFVAYLLTISIMSWSGETLSYLRYLLPFHVIFILFFLSVRFPQRPLNTLFLQTMGMLSVYLMIVSTITLILPTTYRQTQKKILTEYNTTNIIVLSNVPDIAFPISSATALLMEKYTPGRCGGRCRYALKHPITTSFAGTYLLTKTDHAGLQELGERLLQERPDARIILVSADPSKKYLSVENGIGSYFLETTWFPDTLGKEITLEEW